LSCFSSSLSFSGQKHTSEFENSSLSLSHVSPHFSHFWARKICLNSKTPIQHSHIGRFYFLSWVFLCFTYGSARFNVLIFVGARTEARLDDIRAQKCTSELRKLRE
ncbi:hypothetical protein LINPERPRIM_LOCUS22042, partial [Linum perenne]